MYYEGLQRILNAKTADLAAVVRDFTENCVPVYDTGVDEDNEERCLDAYIKAVWAIDRWMNMIVAMDSIQHGGGDVSVSLKFPDGIHLYSCNTTRFSGVDTHEEALPTFETPIGEMDYMVYRCIVDNEDNPVMLFYKALQKHIHRMHILITLDPDGYNDDLITPAILDMCGIQDPLKLHKLDSCLTHIDEFFDAYGFHENSDMHLGDL